MPDPDFEVYHRFGVQRAALGVAHPRAVLASVHGMLAARSNPFDAEGGITGMPADFLVDRRGVLTAVHYGSHADDAWSVDEVIELAQPSRDISHMAPARSSS